MFARMSSRAARLGGAVPVRRTLAVETKSAFKPPRQSGEESKSDMQRLAIIVGVAGLLVGVALLPPNYYGTDKIPIPSEKNTWSERGAGGGGDESK